MIKSLAILCVLSLFVLPGLAEGREAGWVPLEKYTSPLLRDGQTTIQQKKQTAPKKNAQVQNKAPRAADSSVYDGQPPITEKELLSFLELLPGFRSWAHSNKEEAHPILRAGHADFQYSSNAGNWVRDHGWDAPRFFCVMGKMAAALVIVEEGNDMQGTRPADMPAVAPQELSLARKHLGSLLRASYGSTPIGQ